MFIEERHNRIIEIINQKKSVSVSELTEDLGFSPATIRSDLNILNEEAKLIRTHGGATAIENNNQSRNIETKFTARQKMNQEEKIEIANKAFEFIKNDSCIILDASSTTYELAKLINESSYRLMVFTNGINIANLLKNNFNITTTLIGGVIRGDSNAIEGTLGIDILEKVNIDDAFISPHAFNLENGLTDFSLPEVELKRHMVQKAKKIYALIDYTKLNQSSIASFANIQDIDKVFTNKTKIDPPILEEYKKSGLEII